MLQGDYDTTVKLLYHTMISYICKSTSYNDITHDILICRITYEVTIMWCHILTVISQFNYDIMCDVIYVRHVMLLYITCDVMSCHSVISQLCDITVTVKTLWYHMWNHRQKIDSSYVISHSFFHLICDITCDITVWYHMISQCDVVWGVTSVVGSSSRPFISSCLRCNLLVVFRDLKHEPQVNANPLQVSTAYAAQGWWPCLWQLARGPPPLLHWCTASKTAAQQAAASMEWSRKNRPCAKEKWPR